MLSVLTKHSKYVLINFDLVAPSSQLDGGFHRPKRIGIVLWIMSIPKLGCFFITREFLWDRINALSSGHGSTSFVWHSYPVL